MSWRGYWTSLVAFYALPVGLRRLLYTTNAVEAVHRCLRQRLKRRGALPHEMAVMKLCFAMLERLSRRWTHPPGNSLLINQLVLREPGRFEPLLAFTQKS